MANTWRKIAVTITIPVLCGLIALNAYMVFQNVNLIQRNGAERAQAAQMQGNISRILADLQDMETGQRGYLLTGDAVYLEPYTAANERLAADFANLRARLQATPDRALEAQIEAVAQAKVEEMQETIRLRERGYRHRAFLIVASGRGKELMDDARRKLAALSSAQTADVVRYDRELRGSVARAVQESAAASGLLLAVSVLAFLALNFYTGRLEIRAARRKQEHRAMALRLEQFTSTVFNHVRGLVKDTANHAHVLLDVYGGFLPRQGQERAERIEEGAGQMMRVLEELAGQSAGEGETVEVESQRLSA